MLRQYSKVGENFNTGEGVEPEVERGVNGCYLPKGSAW
jgi:hypothetical protein